MKAATFNQAQNLANTMRALQSKKDKMETMNPERMAIKCDTGGYIVSLENPDLARSIKDLVIGTLDRSIQAAEKAFANLQDDPNPEVK